MGHATMENRHGLAVAGMVTLATGTAERRASETMLKAKVKKLGLCSSPRSRAAIYTPKLRNPAPIVRQIRDRRFAGLPRGPDRPIRG